jgi:hypothetical protein
VITSQPNKITPLETTWACLWLARPTQTTSTRLMGCMKGAMDLLWINRWIGYVTRTKHHDTRLEYTASESKSVKWVERKGLAWKDCRRNFWRTCRCSHHHETAYPKRSKSLQQTSNATLTTTGKESAWSCEGMHGMAIMMQCNLSNLSGIWIPTHTYMVQVVVLRDNLNVD